MLRLEDELRRQRARAERLERELREEIQTVFARTGGRSSSTSPPSTLRRGTDGLQQADDQEPGKRSRRRRVARRCRQPGALPEHLLLALLDQELPQQLVSDPAALRAETTAALQAKPAIAGASQQPAAGAAFSRVLDAAFEARKLEDDYVSTEHLLLALGAVPRERLLAKIKEVRGGQQVTSQDPEGTYQALSSSASDLTEAAEQGKLDPVVGRDEEIRRVIGALAPDEEQPGP